MVRKLVLTATRLGDVLTVTADGSLNLPLPELAKPGAVPGPIRPSIQFPGDPSPTDPGITVTPPYEWGEGTPEGGDMAVDIATYNTNGIVRPGVGLNITTSGRLIPNGNRQFAVILGDGCMGYYDNDNYWSLVDPKEKTIKYNEMSMGMRLALYGAISRMPANNMVVCGSPGTGLISHGQFNNTLYGEALNAKTKIDNNLEYYDYRNADCVTDVYLMVSGCDEKWCSDKSLTSTDDISTPMLNTIVSIGEVFRYAKIHFYNIRDGVQLYQTFPGSYEQYSSLSAYYRMSLPLMGVEYFEFNNVIKTYNKAVADKFRRNSNYGDMQISDADVTNTNNVTDLMASHIYAERAVSTSPFTNAGIKLDVIENNLAIIRGGFISGSVGPTGNLVTFGDSRMLFMTGQRVPFRIYPSGVWGLTRSSDDGTSLVITSGTGIDDTNSVYIPNTVVELR